MDALQIKRLVSVELILRHYGSSQDQNGRWRCLFHERHLNDDVHHSVTVLNDRARCWSQNCLGEKGADIFEIVKRKEGLASFPEQKRLVMELMDHWETYGENHPRLMRAYRWKDASGHVAYKLRWETDQKDKRFTWAQDENGGRPGLGLCRPTLRGLDRIAEVPNIIICEGEGDQEVVNEWLQELELTPKFFATTVPNGAADVRLEYLFPLYEKECIYCAGDADDAGKGYNNRIGLGLIGKVHDFRLLMPPLPFKDWKDWKEGGGNAEAFAVLLSTASEIQPISNAAQTDRKDPSQQMPSFSPLSARDFMTQEDEEFDASLESVVDEYLHPATLNVFSAKPKTGKTTLVFELAVKVVQGLPVLNRRTRKCATLIVDVEECTAPVKFGQVVSRF
jgi:hypothetical protein